MSEYTTEIILCSELGFLQLRGGGNYLLNIALNHVVHLLCLVPQCPDVLLDAAGTGPGDNQVTLLTVSLHLLL